ncbi:MAG: hypothetical protein ACRC2R_21730 [Xenococcaceae cyanobacterium]
MSDEKIKSNRKAIELSDEQTNSNSKAIELSDEQLDGIAGGVADRRGRRPGDRGRIGRW